MILYSFFFVDIKIKKFYYMIIVFRKDDGYEGRYS